MDYDLKTLKKIWAWSISYNSPWGDDNQKLLDEQFEIFIKNQHEKVFQDLIADYFHHNPTK